ncbi:glutathione S-transferase family protein [Marinobacter zhejiangensis]|uniref:Glutathione S-transferase n=1 Tax=Marinobacter zhejiangensis TaxID=488535 RepID=A0A1I4LWK1_9GAMM|nr:glutathione S-transferase family protein [Marinobacter zhejiangensis]SFL95391.1 Glutathione S-transferase [Marinobacter zhejiangensis]
MIDLHQFPLAWGVNASPFCLKVETYCRLAGIDYRLCPTPPFKAPRGKLPYIVDDGRTIADSREILAYLGLRRDYPLGSPLTDEQITTGHLLRQLCEESLYFSMLYSRWMDDAYWAETRVEFFQSLPPGVSSLVPHVARRGVIAALKGQGFGRCPTPEVYARAAADLDALAWALGRHPFAVGGAPTEYDATVYAFLFNLLRVPQDTPIRRHALNHPVFADYLQRMDMLLAPQPCAL